MIVYEDLAKASIDMLGRTGARWTQLRYSDDAKPTIFMAAAMWEKDGEEYVMVGAGTNPSVALVQLLEQAIDGGTCLRCGKVSGIEIEAAPTSFGSELVCFYQYDPELVTFRRACE